MRREVALNNYSVGTRYGGVVDGVRELLVFWMLRVPKEDTDGTAHDKLAAALPDPKRCSDYVAGVSIS